MRNEDDSFACQAIKILDCVALTTFSLLVFLSIVGIADYQVDWPASLNRINGVADNVLLIVSLLKIFLYFDKNRVDAIIGGGLLSFFVLLNLLNQCDYVQLVALIVSMMGIKFEKIVKVYISVEGITLLVTFLASAIGLISNVYEERYTALVKNIYYLGFSGHNTPMALCLMLSLALAYHTKKSKVRIQIIVLLMLFLTFMYTITGSNSSFIIGMSIMVLTILEYISSATVENRKFLKTRAILLSILRFAPIYSMLFTILGICYYGRFGRIGLHFYTLVSRFEIIYWELGLAGLHMPFYALREANKEGVNFPFFLSEDLESGAYNNVDFNLLRGLGELKRGQLFGGSDIEYFNILLFDGLIVLIPYILLSMYLLYKIHKKKEYVLMLCIVGSIFYGNFEALKSGYVALQLFLVALLSDCDNDYERENGNDIWYRKQIFELDRK